MRFLVRAVVAAGASLLCASPAAPCSVSRTAPTATELIDRAEVIVIAIARVGLPIPDPPPTQYRSPDVPAWLPTPHIPIWPTPPQLPSFYADLSRAARVRFQVTQTLKGSGVRSLTIQGYLVDRDDFNDAPASSNSPRREARGGPCFASNYRPNAAYLLLLKGAPAGLTPYWAPLSRVNDQLRPGADQWLEWVRQRLAARSR